MGPRYHDESGDSGLAGDALLSDLGMSEVRLGPDGVSLSPPLPGLPADFTYSWFWRRLSPAGRERLGRAWRQAEGGAPFDASVLFQGRVLALRLSLRTMAGLVWEREDAPPLDETVPPGGPALGIVGEDGTIEMASGGRLVGSPLRGLAPEHAARIEAALDEALTEGRAEIPLGDSSEEGARRLLLHHVTPSMTVFLLIDDTLARQATDRADRAVRELNHRVRNAMSVITALISLSAPHAKDVSSFAKATLARVAALDAAYSLTGTNPLRPKSYKTEVPLQDLAETIVGAGEGVDVAPTSLAVSPGQATAVGLILHELATNARRHGCLAAPDGGLALRFENHPADGFSIIWHEHGGERPADPVPAFGLSIIKSFAENYLNGSVEWASREDGVTVTILARSG